ncbi:MAG TPA: FtsW/RodA/SpoVE family cell cycle protein [Rhodospirillales bacterium]|jgi:cell division protein FtsW|nr:FtsW/RodA/SpoVE family cell cycle protein [Rhodospirillales bacterium]
MSTFARTDRSLLGSWWWTVDRWTLAALLAIAAAGLVLTLAASPPVAERLGVDTFHFARRQALFLAAALVAIFATSVLGSRGVRRLGLVIFAVALVATAATPFLGVQLKGATRWISLAGLSVQPSEFVKVGLPVVTAWLFARQRLEARFPGHAISSALMASICALLLLQPDVGTTVVAVAVWGTQLFVAGVSLGLIALLAMTILAGGLGAYFAFHHVQGRIDRFLDPDTGTGYQVGRSLEAFRGGGLFGRGPGEGQIKDVLPDAHADFIFAVAGEEFGLVACLVLVALFAFIVLRGFSRVLAENDPFALFAVTGLLAMFGLQAAVNMASSLNLIPPKGTTLPFISYGGSSALALALAMGMVLALTRERPGRESTR